MTHQESLLSEDWFHQAARDMRRVEVLLAADDVEGAGFHLEQATEKYLKGYLLGKGWTLRRTHDGRFAKYLDQCIMIREFYVQERYPFIDSPPPSRDELKNAMQAIREMVALILQGSD